MSENIKITVDKKTGKVTIEADGFEGNNCLKDLAKVKAALNEEGITLGGEHIQRKKVISSESRSSNVSTL